VGEGRCILCFDGIGLFGRLCVNLSAFSRCDFCDCFFRCLLLGVQFALGGASGRPGGWGCFFGKEWGEISFRVLPDKTSLGLWGLQGGCVVVGTQCTAGVYPGLRYRTVGADSAWE